MRFLCTLKQNETGEWLGSYQGSTDGAGEVGPIQVAANNRDQAVEKLRNEIRYQLELCPCTGESYPHIDLEIVEPRV